MPTSDYMEVTLTNRRSLPPDIEETRSRLSRSLENASDDEINSIKCSPLQRWCERPLEESSGGRKSMAPFERHADRFPIYSAIDEIVQPLRETDVVLLIAPTGSGKSVLAPFIAEQLALTSGSSRKSLLVAPNAEHCGSTARIHSALFGVSGIRVSAFLNPYVEIVGRRVIHDQSRKHENNLPAEFVINTYNSAIRVLPHSKLNLLILDEVHEPNDNVQVTLAMALKMMVGDPFFGEEFDAPDRSLNKLMLMTATIDEKEREKYENYFTSRGLTFECIDLSDSLHRNKQLTMSCLNGSPIPEMFDSTTLSERISTKFKERRHTKDNQETIGDRMRDALDCVMGLACENLQRRLDRGRKGDNFDMQSIIVILPGFELVDRMYSTTFKLNNFNFDGQPGFHPVRLTSLVKDDELITSECSQRGNWEPRGLLGRIVLTTNLVASGLTVPNAAYVIDSGLQKMPREYTRDGLKSLETTLLDKMMIIQRAGRTGRTTDGEYFLPYSVNSVDEMVKTKHGHILLHRHFDERHFLYKKLYNLELLHNPPKPLIKELRKGLEIRGVYNASYGVYPDAIIMNTLFNFLSPEHARIVIQGTRLGIAAHTALLVAESISSVKFCHVGSHGRGMLDGPSETKSAIHLYCEAMDGKDRKFPAKFPEKYGGVGDSIASADLLASFYSVVPRATYRSDLDKCAMNYNNFWSGKRDVERESVSLSYLYSNFVRDEGRDAVSRFLSQIESALRGAGFLPPNGSIFNPDLNRHIVSADNFCLDGEGRALLSALLTMHSSRVGKLITKSKDQPIYEIYRMSKDELVRLYPEATVTQPDPHASDETIYGRYTELFEKRGNYTGCIDPISLKQLCFFININGLSLIQNVSYDKAMTFKLNAAPAKGGFRVNADANTIGDVNTVRSLLEKALMILTHTKNEPLIKDIEKFIISLWRECEEPLKPFDPHPPSPPDEDPDNVNPLPVKQTFEQIKEERKKKKKEDQEKRKEEQKKQKGERKKKEREQKEAEDKKKTKEQKETERIHKEEMKKKIQEEKKRKREIEEWNVTGVVESPTELKNADNPWM